MNVRACLFLGDLGMPLQGKLLLRGKGAHLLHHVWWAVLVLGHLVALAEAPG